MYICIYVYMYICVYVYMYICIYVYMYICIYVYMYYMYICIYVYVYAYAYVYVWVCVYVYVYVHVSLYIYIYIIHTCIVTAPIICIFRCEYRSASVVYCRGQEGDLTSDIHVPVVGISSFTCVYSYNQEFLLGTSVRYVSQVLHDQAD